jgi:hypothetical protein
MTRTELPVFDKTIQETNTWLKHLMKLLEIDDRHAAYVLLRATLVSVPSCPCCYAAFTTKAGE